VQATAPTDEGMRIDYQYRLDTVLRPQSESYCLRLNQSGHRQLYALTGQPCDQARCARQRRSARACLDPTYSFYVAEEEGERIWLSDCVWTRCPARGDCPYLCLSCQRPSQLRCRRGLRGHWRSNAHVIQFTSCWPLSSELEPSAVNKGRPFICAQKKKAWQYFYRRAAFHRPFETVRPINARHGFVRSHSIGRAWQPGNMQIRFFLFSVSDCCFRLTSRAGAT